jgi:peptidyl-tRNA hydrolase
MYSFVNRSLDMTPGKIAAQAQHAAVEAYRISDPELLKEWYLGGHYCKLVMLAEDDVHLLTIQKYIEERGFKTKLIIDEGRTEIRPHSTTALGVEVVDRDNPHTAATFESFQLYKEKKPPKPSLEEVQRQYTEPYGSWWTQIPPRWPRRNRQ